MTRSRSELLVGDAVHRLALVRGLIAEPSPISRKGHDLGCQRGSYPLVRIDPGGIRPDYALLHPQMFSTDITTLFTTPLLTVSTESGVRP
jgi:hypothetical protein